MDILTKKQRSLCMSRVKGKNTKLEIALRKYLYSCGIRGYRINSNKISGKPDIYFPKRKLAVFIDGCFWHKCPICFEAPATNTKFWSEKIERNVIRDREVNEALQKSGIKVIRIWGHQIKNPNGLDSIMEKMRRIFN